MLSTLLLAITLSASPDTDLDRAWAEVQLADQGLAAAIEQRPSIAKSQSDDYEAKVNEAREAIESADRLEDNITIESPASLIAGVSPFEE